MPLETSKSIYFVWNGRRKTFQYLVGNNLRLSILVSLKSLWSINYIWGNHLCQPIYFCGSRFATGEVIFPLIKSQTGKNVSFCIANWGVKSTRKNGANFFTLKMSTTNLKKQRIIENSLFKKIRCTFWLDGVCNPVRNV